jgi:colanic acid/amylovoran biosynthesis glycosyltransferase
MVNILVYRDLIVPKSEIAFLRRQYLGFEHLTPHWIGRKITPLAPQLTKDPILIGGEGPGGIPARILFKQFGIVTPSPEIAALAPRLVHAQFGRGGALALPLARVLGVPLVVTYHGGDASKDKHYRPGLIPSVYQRRLTALKETASLFICVSESVRAKLIERGFPADKLIVNPIGVEMPPAPQGRTEEHLLFVGRFVEKKGLAVLIEAMRRVRANGVTTPLVLVGDGPLFTDIQHAASDISGLSFLGWQEGEAVRRNMARAVAVLVPSVRAAGGDAEGLPSVAAEAMSLGVPVIASDEAGLDGVIHDRVNGRMVPARNGEALASAIAETIADAGARRTLGQAGRKTAERELSATAQSRRLEEILSGLIRVG